MQQKIDFKKAEVWCLGTTAFQDKAGPLGQKWYFCFPGVSICEEGLGDLQKGPLAGLLLQQGSWPAGLGSPHLGQRGPSTHVKRNTLERVFGPICMGPKGQGGE